MKSLIKAVAIILVLALIFLGSVSYYISSSKTNYEKEVEPMVWKILPELTSWNMQKISKHLDNQTKERLKTPEGQNALRLFAKLGSAKSCSKPMFLGSKRGFDFTKGVYEFVSYKLKCNFENGKGVMRLILKKSDGNFLIDSFYIDSDLFRNYQ